ncbi:hypothetical protein M407DRAFT_28961 [Tulasnella calospora MUT 4182]|uniref:Glycosyltransferase family 1 protein n=1 Tax=Tulasnella calospora MUT 4182 TaxID=1051891 RepID=A0A0C3Q0E7_9AGAM|nr:hypothetical protein M407DRAFT_28961 [Tulasnella calospora MUT 4182]
MASPSLHFVACNYPALGHTRPQLGLITRLIQNHSDLLITIFVYSPYVPSTRKELQALLPNLSRVRLIGVGPFSDNAGRGFESLFPAYVSLQELIPASYKEIVAGGSLTCTATGNVFDYASVPIPTIILSDLATPFAGQGIKAITPDVKLLVSWMGTTSFFIHRFGPDELGGYGSLEEKATAALVKDNLDEKSFMEVAFKFESNFKGNPLINAEDLAMFDYEIFPQDVDNASYTPVYINAAKQTNGWADGVAICSTGDFEPKARQVLQDWYEGTHGKRAFFVGPYTAPRDLSKSLDFNGDASMLLPFLESHPKQSVWLISFGTLFYPSRHPSQIETVLRTLLKTGTPFIMSVAASMYTPLPDDILREAKDRGLGLFADFLPQTAVLAHPSTGVFVSHAGVNSMFESIEANVLNVFWPMTCDQPIHAAHMTLKLDASYELIQVRTGTGAQPPKRGDIVEGTDEAIAQEIAGIVEDLKGPVGERKRRNLAAVRSQLLADLAKGGDADAEVQKLINFGTPV